MATVSICMIVKNEEDVLGRCLESIEGMADEIIVVDTGSTDRTKEIASRFTERIYDFKWIDDFAAARNFAFSLAAMEYCMWLDADDLFLEEDCLAFKKMKKSLSPSVDVVMMKYNTGFDEKGNVTFSYYRERLIKNHAGMLWKGAVHEVIEPRGEIIYSECAVTHRKLHPSDPDRNLRIFEKLIADGKELDPRQQYYYARELYYHKRYSDAAAVFEAFLDEGNGWLENKIDACLHCSYCRFEMGEWEQAVRILFRSFVYDSPRAEICCEIGKLFMEKQQFVQAAYWYECARGCERDDSRGGFTSADCYTYIPCIQLCVCYDRLGSREKACEYNELAALYKPDSKAVEMNRNYFEGLHKSEGKS